MDLRPLDSLYLQLLHIGLQNVRDAADQGDISRCLAESHYLHNIPSLIGSDHVERHHFHATSERVTFLRWVQEVKRADVNKVVVLRYNPLWEKMDKILGLE